MEVDWDLHAVVRACCSTASTTSSAASTTAATPVAGVGAGAASTWFIDAYNQQKRNLKEENSMGFFPDPFQSRNDNSIEQFLKFLNKPLEFPKLQKLTQSSQILPISPLSVLGGLQDPLVNHHQHQQQKQLQGKQQSFCVSRCTTSNAQGTRSKKRKNQMKRVCQVPAEGLSSDVWSWRKYGQKPIKGSPYPRGYYKCSTLKGCSARKQVERNRSDPGMLIITYTGEHTHPVPAQSNSLAGTTRNKTATTVANDNGNKPTPSSPVSPTTSLPPVPEKMNETEKYDTDDDNNFDVSGVVIDEYEDTFDGLDELVGSVVGDIFPDHHVASKPAPGFPWLSNNLTTTTSTAAGGS